MKVLLFLPLFTLISIVAFSQTNSILENTDRSKFVELTERRVNDLEEYIKTIGDKSLESDLKDATVDAAVKLFYSEENIFQVSSKNRSEVRDYTIRRYLKKIQVLPYSKVEIEWFKTEWISNFRQAPDGKYFGVVRIYQVFKGYGDAGDLKYTDVTSKNIEVQIEVANLEKENLNEQFLMVRLGDVKVEETK